MSATGRIHLHAYSIDEAEWASYQQIARSALDAKPVIDGFDLAIFGAGAEARRFLEVWLLPDADVTGIDVALEGYHYSSSYQPERTSCLEPGALMRSFRGRPTTEPPARIDGLLCRLSVFGAPEEPVDVSAALAVVVEHAQHRSTIVALECMDALERWSLLEIFESQSALDDAAEADRVAGGPLAEALSQLAGCLRADAGTPGAFTRVVTPSARS